MKDVEVHWMPRVARAFAVLAWLANLRGRKLERAYLSSRWRRTEPYYLKPSRHPATGAKVLAVRKQCTTPARDWATKKNETAAILSGLRVIATEAGTSGKERNAKKRARRRRR